MFAETVFQEISGTLFLIAFLAFLGMIGIFVCAARLARILNNLREINERDRSTAVHINRVNDVTLIRLKAIDESLGAMRQYYEPERSEFPAHAASEPMRETIRLNE